MSEPLSPACCTQEQAFLTLQEQLPSPEAFARSIACFKVLSDENRCRIIYALSLSELCVGHLAELLGSSPSAVSHQLGRLKLEGFVKARKAGKEVYYSLSDDHLKGLLLHVLKHQENEGEIHE